MTYPPSYAKLDSDRKNFMGRLVEPGLLSCCFCGEDLEFYGKEGTIFQTKCPSCGISSDALTDQLFSREKIQPEAEVYYHRKAPASIPPG